MRPLSRLAVTAALGGCCVCLSVGSALAAAPKTEVKGGILYTDNRPVLKTSAYFGFNAWGFDEELFLGPFLKQPLENVGVVEGHYANDPYVAAGFNNGHYAVSGHEWFNVKPYDPQHTRECLRRAETADLMVTLDIWCTPAPAVTDRMGLHWINQDGEKIPFGKKLGMHHDPEVHAAAIVATYRDVFDTLRDEPRIVDWQIGGERWPYDYIRLRPNDVSFDDYSLNEFRKYLRSSHTLEDISHRYGDSDQFYSGWDEVFPPIPTRPLDLKRRELKNFDLAQWDWYCFRKAQTVKVWVRMIEALQELDGRGRLFNFEHGHGPYYSMGFNPFPEIVAKTKNFSVGNGFFGTDLKDLTASMIQVKACGDGPWFNNELGAGTRGRYKNAAHLRRSVWGTIALGASGYNLWTFLNLQGLPYEFIPPPFLQYSANFPLKYFDVQRSNKMLVSLGDLLAGSRIPEAPIAMMLLDDSIFLYKYTLSYHPDSDNITRAMASNGLADQYVMQTEYHLDNTDLSHLKTIFLPRTQRLTDAHNAKLAQYVERGGTLVLMGPSVRVDEKFKEYPVFPYGPLAVASGVEARRLTGAAMRQQGLAAVWDGKGIHLNISTGISLPEGSSAQVIAHDAQGLPAATVNQYGKGRCYFLAGYPVMLDDQDATGEFIAAMAGSSGARPAVTARAQGRVDHGIFLARRVAETGTLLFMIENQDARHQLEMTIDPEGMGLDKEKTYNVFDLFGDESHQVNATGAWAFSTDLNPIEVRCFLITEEGSLDNVIPVGKRYMAKRHPGEVISPRGPLWDPWRVGDVLDEQLRHKSTKNIMASAGNIAPAPLKLAPGLVALNLEPFANKSMSTMIKDIDLNAFVNYGADAQAAVDQSLSPIQRGINHLGEVPSYSSGSYIDCNGEVRGIPVGRKAISLHFFHGGHLSEHSSVLGYYRVRYGDGTSAQVPIVYNSTLGDFSRGNRYPEKTVNIWSGKSERGQRSLSRYDWTNPQPEKLIVAVDIVNSANADNRSFSVWAITARVSD